jgi:hypothetical protein
MPVRRCHHAECYPPRSRGPAAPHQPGGGARSVRRRSSSSATTPSGEPRSAGVMYTVIYRKLYVVTGPDSWKARHIALDGRVAVTVPVRRGGVLSLLAPIPPVTISFHGTAIVHPPDSPAVRPVLEQLGALLPRERRDSVAILESTPQGTFASYGVGIALARMRDPDAARARVPVTHEASHG